jgi:uncharacterized membrane protein (UPF0127 family)
MWPRVGEVSCRLGAIQFTRVRVCANFFRRLRGLLGFAQLPPLGGALIWPAGSVHTFAMKFAIDVLYLDKSGVVVKVAQQVRPNRVSFGPWKSFAVLEVAAGAAGRIELGTQCVWSEQA